MESSQEGLCSRFVRFRRGFESRMMQVFEDLISDFPCFAVGSHAPLDTVFEDHPGACLREHVPAYVACSCVLPIVGLEKMLIA